MIEATEQDVTLDCRTLEGQEAIRRRIEEREYTRREEIVYAMRAAAIEADDVNHE